jgi:SprT-like family
MTHRARKTAQRRSYQRVADQPIAITPIEYSGLQEAYDHCNAELFGGSLGDVFITYQRKAHSAGYFSPDRFSGRIGEFGKHELALNPDGFIGQTDEQILQTLVHEMAHVWQHTFGKPSARGYHNKEWAAKMKEIGLQPSSTGMVDGKETGQRMRDYVIPSGLFAKAYAKLAATGWKLNLQSAHRPSPKGTNNSKTKFSCAACGQNAWGKPDLAVICMPCGIQMRAADISAAIAATDIPYQIIKPPVLEPPKRKRGRPKGSKNKPKLAA